MPDPFVHLNVKSGYSLQYAAAHPATLVERAVEHEMDTLALTDRDGCYGAVRFAKACLTAGVRPVLGVDLAMASSGTSYESGAGDHGSYDGPGARGRQLARTPVRGGAFRDPRLPRVRFLAASRRGWATVCRLVSATHLAGERGDPVCSMELVAQYLGNQHLGRAERGDVLVMLGPDSVLGRAAAAGPGRRDELAHAELARWLAVVDRADLLVELVSHRLPGAGPGSAPHAARMAGIAHEARLQTVLTNAVRYADRTDAPTVDVLDAARRLVALDARHVDRGNAEGFVKSGKQMAEVAEEICRFAGTGHDTEHETRRLLARTRAVADRCALDPRADLGLGEVHLPELPVIGGGFETSSGCSATADGVLRARCEAGIGRRYGAASQKVLERLDEELAVIGTLGYAPYFLTVADVTDLVKAMGVRCAARGSGAGSLVNYLLGISGVDPLRHGLLMERFLSPLRQALPDIDVDVESARRLEVYQAILDRYGGERCVCVSMMDTYRVRHAVRDVGAALGMPPGEVDVIAKAFPHIRARDARVALRELPELRASGLAGERLDLFFGLVERLDGLPRHVAVHPCGVLLSDATLLDRTPVEASYAGFPMSQFDKDDVEDLGLLKLDVLGVRMQSAMAHAVTEIKRVDGVEVDLDDDEQVPFDDPATFELISAAQTLGCFQIESPGQRELVGKSGIESFADIITDISLFRPGPVKSDMVTPYLEAKQGWRAPTYLHEDLRPILAQTSGVVVFHEQVIEVIALFTGCTLAEADEARRALGDTEGMAEVKVWFFPRALARGYTVQVVQAIWTMLASFAAFGFCKAHAAAFALPTYQSAWLKAHWPAHFLAGVLTHDPGMYPKRLILDDARQHGIAVLGLDVNASEKTYTVERCHPQPLAALSSLDGRSASARLRSSALQDTASDTARGDEWEYAIRVSLSEVKGITEAEVDRVLAARPFSSLADFWHRACLSRPVVERLVLAGGFDSVYGIDVGRSHRSAAERGVQRRATVTRRDLLLQVADLDRVARSGGASRPTGASRAATRACDAAARNSPSTGLRTSPSTGLRTSADPWRRAARQSQATPPAAPVRSVQLSLDIGDTVAGDASGLPEMSPSERVGAELEVLGLDVSTHVVDFYAEFLDALEVTRSRDLLSRRSRSQLLVAGVKVATQTPPIRSGRRVVFLTLDDATGPVDATFFEDAQGPYAATVFGSWLLVVRGELRRTGRRGVSLRATGCWDLPMLHDAWRHGGLDAVEDLMAAVPLGFTGGQPIDEDAAQGAADSRSTRPVTARPGSGSASGMTAGGMGRRRVLVSSSGFAMSPYSDVKPAGEDTKTAPRKLWHSSPGSSGG